MKPQRRLGPGRRSEGVTAQMTSILLVATSAARYYITGVTERKGEGGDAECVKRLKVNLDAKMTCSVGFCWRLAGVVTWKLYYYCIQLYYYSVITSNY